MKMDRSSPAVILGPQQSADKCGIPGFRIGDPWKWERHELVSDEKFTITLSDQLTTRTDKFMAEQPPAMSDTELIRRALSKAPEAVTKDATVIAMGADGKMRTLRQGTGEWTCIPGNLDPAFHPTPICGKDKNGMERLAALWANLKRSNLVFSFRTLPNLEGADIVLIVSYRPWFLPWTYEKPFRFVAEMQPNDKVMWKPRPMN